MRMTVLTNCLHDEGEHDSATAVRAMLSSEHITSVDRVLYSRGFSDRIGATNPDAVEEKGRDTASAPVVRRHVIPMQW